MIFFGISSLTKEAFVKSYLKVTSFLCRVILSFFCFLPHNFYIAVFLVKLSLSTSYHSQSKFSHCRPRCDLGNSLLFKAKNARLSCNYTSYTHTQSLSVYMRSLKPRQKSHVPIFLSTFHKVDLICNTNPG